METFAEVVLPPLITALLAVVGVATRQWRQRRSKTFTYEHALDRAIREVTFLHTWLEAHALTSTAGAVRRQERAVADLEATYRTIAELRGQLTARPQAGAPLRDALRSVLVLGITSGWAKTLRLLYYVTVLWTLGLSIMLAAFVVTDDSDVSIAARVVGTLMFAVTFGGLTLGLRALVLLIDRRRQRATTVHSTWSPPDRAPTSMSGPMRA